MSTTSPARWPVGRIQISASNSVLPASVNGCGLVFADKPDERRRILLPILMEAFEIRENGRNPGRAEQLHLVLDGLAVRQDGLFAPLRHFGDDRKSIAGGSPRENRAIPPAFELKISFFWEGICGGLGPSYPAPISQSA